MVLAGRIRAYGNQSGEFRYEDPDKVEECSSFTCQHCNHVVPVPVGADPANIGGMCKSCMGLICPRCVNLGACDPIEKKIERMEELERFYRNL